MNAAAIDYIWKAIQESERSGESRFMDYELLAKAAAAYLVQQRLEQSGAAASEPIGDATLSRNFQHLIDGQLAELPQPEADDQLIERSRQRS
jgi:hypothetical protein